MSKKKKPTITPPPTPSFQSEPTVGPNVGLLTDVGRGLLSGRFFNPLDQQLGFLSPLVTLNPEATQRAIELATRGTIETRGLAQQDILNQLAASNQLESSVAVNRLADLNRAFGRDVADINTRFYLADVERSLANISDLFKQGLSTTQQAGSLGLTSQAQQNEFALQNYQNQLTAQLLAQPHATRGGVTGGLTGAAGGAATGAAIGSIIPGVGTAIGALIGAGLGGAAGAFGAPGTGGSLFQSGALALGSRFPTLSLPGGTAANRFPANGLNFPTADEVALRGLYNQSPYGTLYARYFGGGLGRF